MGQGFRGNCDSQGKLGMCPSLAEPDSGGFSKNRGLSIISRRQIKSFSVQQFFKNAAEVWASSPHLRSKRNCTVSGYEPQATKKFFDPTIFQKCWRGVGEQPTFAKQITELHNETKQKSKRESKESQLPFRIRRL